MQVLTPKQQFELWSQKHSLSIWAVNRATIRLQIIRCAINVENKLINGCSYRRPTATSHQAHVMLSLNTIISSAQVRQVVLSATGPRLAR